jgi:hypothetical protein
MLWLGWGSLLECLICFDGEGLILFVPYALDGVVQYLDIHPMVTTIVFLKEGGFKNCYSQYRNAMVSSKPIHLNHQSVQHATNSIQMQWVSSKTNSSPTAVSISHQSIPTASGLTAPLPFRIRSSSRYHFKAFE